VENADKKSKKGWLFNKHKKTPSVCTSSSTSRSPELIQILTPELMQQMMRLIDFLLLDESKCIILKNKLIYNVIFQSRSSTGGNFS
jgi:hypothetical protein